MRARRGGLEGFVGGGGGGGGATAKFILYMEQRSNHTFVSSHTATT